MTCGMIGTPAPWAMRAAPLRMERISKLREIVPSANTPTSSPSLASSMPFTMEAPPSMRSTGTWPMTWKS